MELVQQKRRRPRLSPIAIHRQLPIYLRFILGLSLGVVVVVSGTAALSRFAQPPSNPFAPYADIQPGLARSVLVDYGFSCANSGVANDRPFNRGIAQYCVLLLENGLFDHIGAMVSGNVVRQVFFSVRENALTVGHLVILWGRPPMIARERDQMTLAWDPGEWTILANANGTRFSYLMPLRRVVFMAAP